MDMPPNIQPPAIIQNVQDAADAEREARAERERVARELEQATIANNQPTTSQPK